MCPKSKPKRRASYTLVVNGIHTSITLHAVLYGTSLLFTTHYLVIRLVLYILGLVDLTNETLLEAQDYVY